MPERITFHQIHNGIENRIFNYFDSKAMYPGYIEFKTPIGNRKAILLLSPESLNNVWKKYDSNGLDKIGPSYDLMRNFAGDGLFPSKGGPNHKERKRLLAPTIVPDNLSLVSIETIKQKLDSENHGAGHESFTINRLVNFYRFLTADIVLKSYFGKHLDNDEIKKIFLDIQSIVNRVSSNVFSFSMIENLASIVNQDFFGAYHAKDNIRDAAISFLETQDSTDFLSELIKTAPDNDSRIDEIITLISAGTGTTSILTSWTTLLMAKHPELQQRIRKEIIENSNSHTLINSLKEVLRLYPPIFATYRIADRNIEERSNIDIDIPKGSAVIISPFITHRLKTYWDNSSEFNPDRFLSNTYNSAYIPFGLGQRRCIGKDTAYTIAYSVLSHIISNYQISNDGKMGFNIKSTLKPSNKASVGLIPIS